MNIEFLGKHALVTGAASGIGSIVAAQLIELGCDVTTLDIQPTNLSSLKHYTVDLTDSDTVERTVNEIESSSKPIDYLVHCAAVLELSNLLETSNAQWQRQIDVNLNGAFYICRAVGNVMKRQKKGTIVVVSSNAAKTPRLGMGAYCASKAALTQMTKCLGLELAGYNVNCNVVAPGSTLTPMQKQLWSSETDEMKAVSGSLEQFKLGIPIGRIADPIDISNTILFLLSPFARHITLESITVDGGATLGQ